MWKAVIDEVRDIGNGTGDVVVSFYKDAILKSRQTFNFHAPISIQDSTIVIQKKLQDLKDFDDLLQQISLNIGQEITL